MSRELLQQALMGDYPQLIAAVRRYLAQPEAEPVAIVAGIYGGRFTVAPLNRARVLMPGMALYATPPAQPAPAVREPLTDEHLYDLLRRIDPMTVRLPPGYRAFARAIEQAHGITGDRK